MRGVPRAVRLVGLAGLALLSCLVVAAGVVVHSPRQRSPHWATFAFGPASGASSSVQADGIRADGISLTSAIALAYDLPTVRVIGPPWLSERRYSLSAIVPKSAVNDVTISWRPLLQQELSTRLRLETHVELRPFDVLVLTVDSVPRLTRAPGGGLSVWVGDQRARFHNATMADLAHVLQGILGQPVVDETGLRGTYDLEFGWRNDRVPSVMTTLEEQFGLQLSSGRRDLEALIVDDVRRDASLVLAAQAERLTRSAPASLRRRIAGLLTTH